MNALRKSKKLMEELRFMLKHADRKSNELIFMKCVNPRCKHCSENPIIATTAWEDLKKNDFKWYNPMASTKFPGHYMTFLESLEVDTQLHKTGEFTDDYNSKKEKVVFGEKNQQTRTFFKFLS